MTFAVASRQEEILTYGNRLRSTHGRIVINPVTVLQVGLLLRGECGILFTNEKTADVLEYFQNLAESDYAR